MLHPLVEKLPSYVMSEGRKDLTCERVNFLRSLITKLQEVNSEDLGNAFNKIGIIYVYLNEPEEAIIAFEKSLSNKYSEVTYSNYLQTLDRLGKFKEAIEQGLNFLEKNPNNKKIFSTVLSIIDRYPNIDYLEPILKCFKYQYDSEIYFAEEAMAKKQIENELAILTLLKVDLAYFNLITNIAFSEVAKIQIGSIGFHSFFNEDVGQLLVNVSVFGIDKEDINILNKNFDDRINLLIETEEISFDIYLDHLMKFAFSFTTNNTSQLVA